VGNQSELGGVLKNFQKLKPFESVNVYLNQAAAAAVPSSFNASLSKIDSNPMYEEVALQPSIK
jgi:hypothetical protein